MRQARWVLGLAVLAVALSPTVAEAKNNKGGSSPGHSKSSTSNPNAGSAHGNSGGFSLVEIDVVRSFFVGNPSYRGSSLPPGIAKNYARGKPLPPGIAKKMVPHDLLVRLPERAGYTYYIVDDDIALVSIATGIVIDIIADVFG